MKNKSKRFNAGLLSAILCLIVCFTFFGINMVDALINDNEESGVPSLFEYSDGITGFEEDYDFKTKQIDNN